MAEATWRACRATGRERAQWQERAAQSMLRLGVPEQAIASGTLLAEATWQLDGADAAQQLLDSLVRDDGTAWLPVAVLRMRLAGAQGDWVSVLAYAEGCLQADAALAAKVRPDWLRALRATWDRPEAMKQLTALPEALQDGHSHALLASLQYASDDRAGAGRSWARALASGWTDFDTAFIRALPDLELTPQTLHALAKDAGNRTDEVRTSVAGNPRTPPQLLEALSHGSPAQAIAVAGNPASPGALLTQLARRHEASIRRAVAASQACPVEVMELLVDDPDPGVRMSIRDHPRCPQDLRVHASLTL
jgi:hypothetical protein